MSASTASMPPGGLASAPMEASVEPNDAPRRSGLHGLPWRRILLPLAIIVAAAAVTWRTAAPARVALVRPQVREITETIASSGIVTGRREAVVGARIPGVVSELLVREGDEVLAGQLIARIANEVADAQVDQARQSVNRANAQLRQAAMRPRKSEVEAARARVRQAQAGVGEVLPQIERAEMGVVQASAAVDQAVANVSRARALVRQADARRELADKTVNRYRSLFDEGAIAANALDQAVAELASAEADKSAATQGVIVAQNAVESARAAVTAAVKEVEALQTRAVAAGAALSAAQADLQTLEAGPRFESVEAAREQTFEAGKAVEVARTQALQSEVRAPFAGTVTAILAEKGASVASAGVVRLVERVTPEVRLNVDENNLADLHVGQEAQITSSAFREKSVGGKVIRIGARVDSARGTVEVSIIPLGETAWLRPGQTVNVNVILSDHSRKLVVPRSAVRQEAGRSVVLKIIEGRAAPHQVETGPAREGFIPILKGLSENDRIILDAEYVKTGARVRAGK